MPQFNPFMKKKGSKYNNTKVEYDGVKFDSIKEKNRYITLKMLEKGGVIKDLELQPSFLLQDKFTDVQGVKHRAIKYKGDFKYYCNDRKMIITEDVKASKFFTTDVYKLKKKLLLFKFKDINFIEIYKA